MMQEDSLRTMVPGSIGPLWRMLRRMLPAALVLLVCTGVCACNWFRYEDQLRTHTDLMETIAADAADGMRVPGYRLRPADLQTMAYPLERAMRLIDDWKSARSGDAAMARFEEFAAAYQALYTYMDEVRTLEDDAAGDRRLARLGRKVELAAAAVRDVIDN